MSDELLVVGADVDARALMAEVSEEVRRKRAAGLYPPEVLRELGETDVSEPGDRADDRQALQPALADLQRSSRFTALVTTASRRPVIAPVIAGARRALRASLIWYMNGILEQLNRFAEHSVRATGLLAEREDHLDDRLEAVRAEVTRLQEWRSEVDALRLADRLARLDRAVRDLRDRLERGGAAPAAAAPAAGSGPVGERPGAWSWESERSFDYLEFENRFRGDPEEIARRQSFYVDLFRDAPGKVVDLGCGRGEFLGLLQEAEISAYGVDRHPDMVGVCREKGYEVVEADSLEHLAAAKGGSLGGIFCAQMIEHLKPAEVPRFFELAADALAPGAPLVVETINPESLFVFAHALYVDLGHLRPLHPLTLEFLAQAVGFSSVKVEYLSPTPADFRPQPLPEVEDETLATVVSRLDENFRRIDDILFGPQDFAVIAHR